MAIFSIFSATTPLKFPLSAPTGNTESRSRQTTRKGGTQSYWPTSRGSGIGSQGSRVLQPSWGMDRAGTPKGGLCLCQFHHLSPRMFSWYTPCCGPIPGGPLRSSDRTVTHAPCQGAPTTDRGHSKCRGRNTRARRSSSRAGPETGFALRIGQGMWRQGESLVTPHRLFYDGPDTR
jgi:hypothetical protein